MSELRNLDVSAKMEKKGKFNYLSWAWAVDKLIEFCPNAEWEVKRFPMIVKNGDDVIAIPEMLVPYMKTGAGHFVEVEVIVHGVRRTQIHPVLDFKNKPVDKPSAFDINTAIQRCLAKAIALHGLGLYIYAGEDLPPEDEQVSPEPIDMVKVNKAAEFFKVEIDKDDPDATYQKIVAAYNRLSNDERIEVDKLLHDKAPDSNTKYKNLLKQHLDFVPE